MQTMKIWPSEIKRQVHRHGSGMRELGEKRHAFNQSLIHSANIWWDGERQRQRTRGVKLRHCRAEIRQKAREGGGDDNVAGIETQLAEGRAWSSRSEAEERGTRAGLWGTRLRCRDLTLQVPPDGCSNWWRPKQSSRWDNLALGGILVATEWSNQMCLKP